MIRFSVIIPVFNRPQEIEELLKSLTHQTIKNFEVIIVEDGSEISSKEVVGKYTPLLNIQYFFKLNSGPGPSRNFGFEKAHGDFFVVFDSDCIIPPQYFEAVEKALLSNPLDAWGGPDKGSPDFTPLQRAMAYTMSSMLTTGGIRGASSRNFQPRSYNMGISRAVFEKTNGFRLDRLAEDIELSIRMRNLDFRVGLIPEAFVYHKRRTDFRQFFRQVSGFGKGRIQVGRFHPGAIKLTHWFPAVFFAGQFVVPFLLWLNIPLGIAAISAYGIYLWAVATGALISTGSLQVSVLSIPAAIVQLNGYGSGFLKEMFRTGV